MSNKTYQLPTREGKINYYSKGSEWIKKLIKIAANRVLFDMTDEEIDEVDSKFAERLDENGESLVPCEKWRSILEEVMVDYPEVSTAFLAAHQKENAEYYEEICSEMNKIVKMGDQSNGSVDSSLTSSKRALIVDAVEKITYRNYHLTQEQKEKL
jgi:ribonucleoside-triphosphate reductase